jgi:hypothetical protein
MRKTLQFIHISLNSFKTTDLQIYLFFQKNTQIRQNAAILHYFGAIGIAW